MSTPDTQPIPCTIHLVFSSHWDREWYLPFQKFREKLVRVLDGVFEHLESGRLPFYQMDGQFIPVEDYLEIRPEKEPLVRRMIREGRFRVGPWYNLPDGFLVSGESIARNFLLGMKRSEAFGGASPSGWLCDIFGHNSQMPQVLRQLGIDNAFLWRGVDVSLGDRFWWEGSDGSRVLTHRFPPFGGYSSGSFALRQALQRKERPDRAKMQQNARDWLKADALRGPQPRAHMLWWDGGDHMEFDPMLLDMVDDFNADAPAGRKLVVSTLDQYTQGMREEGLSGDVVWRGEMREACSMDGDNWLIPGVGSSRIPLKRANHAGETLLTLWAEPWAAVASARHGLEWPARALELAWEFLLRNHPHDSICGCSTDETHNDMPYRFDQSRQLAEVHLDRALKVISAEIHRGAKSTDEGSLAVTLFTSAGGIAQTSPELTVQLPEGWPQFSDFFGFEAKPSLRVYTLDGREVPYQLLEVTPKTTYTGVAPFKFPHAETRQRIRLALDATVDPLTATPFVLKRAEGPTRHPQTGALGISRYELQNEFLHLKAEGDGTLTLTERGSGRSYPGLLAMEDTADIGDGWFHGPALQDRAYLSTGGNVTYGVTENGPLLARLHVRVEWLVPAEFDFGPMRRSEKLTPLVVEHLVTLRKGARHVEISSTIHNHVRDHRLRLFCPTGLTGAKTFWADSPFDAVERPIALRTDNHLLRECQVEMTPQQNWVAVSDQGHGLCLLAPGQYESGVLDQPDRPLALTLLRSFRRAVMTDGNEGGQIQGAHRIELELSPFAVESGRHLPITHFSRLAQSLTAPARAVFHDAQEISELSIPPQSSSQPWPTVRGEVVFSAYHREDSATLVIRVYNPANQPAAAELRGGGVWRRTNLRGSNAEAVASPLTLRPKEIVTLRVTT